MALLVDTSHVLGKIHGIPPTVLATTEIPIHVPWMATSARLVATPDEGSSWRHNDLDDFIVQSAWRAEIHSRDCNEKDGMEETVVQYAITKRCDGTSRLEWSRTRNTMAEQ